MRRIKRRFMRRIKRPLALIQDVLFAYRQRRDWPYLAIHKRSLTTMPPWFAVPLLCGHVKGKLSCPAEITILLIHTHDKETILEKSLRYTGIKNFVVRVIELDRPWCASMRDRELKNFLDSGSCKTEYILFLDSDDVALRDNPAKALQYLKDEDCDMLFSDTAFLGGYECMPEIKGWTDEIAAKSGFGQRYINAGIFIAKTSFLREVMESVMQYVTDHDLSREEYRELRRNGCLCERLPSFPEGVGDDQVIFRYLHPKFYPRMKIDYRGRLALRK